MKSLRTKRDEQQWILDLALNMRGRVQNFERDDWETPTRSQLSYAAKNVEKKNRT